MKIKLGLTLIAASSLIINSAIAETITYYKTLSNQVVVTGLKPKTKYVVITNSFQGRNGKRTITTNSCGEALISNGTGYRSLIINNKPLIPSTLKNQTHQRCNQRRSNSNTTTISPINR